MFPSSVPLFEGSSKEDKLWSLNNGNDGSSKDVADMSRIRLGESQLKLCESERKAQIKPPQDGAVSDSWYICICKLVPGRCGVRK